MQNQLWVCSANFWSLFPSSNWHVYHIWLYENEGIKAVSTDYSISFSFYLLPCRRRRIEQKPCHRGRRRRPTSQFRSYCPVAFFSIFRIATAKKRKTKGFLFFYLRQAACLGRVRVGVIPSSSLGKVASNGRSWNLIYRVAADANNIQPREARDTKLTGKPQEWN